MLSTKIFLLAFVLAVVVNDVFTGKTGKLENDAKLRNDAANDGPHWWEVTEEKREQNLAVNDPLNEDWHVPY